MAEVDVRQPPADPVTISRTMLAKINRLVARGRRSELHHYLTTHPILNEIDESPVDGLFVHAIESGNGELATICLEIGAKVDGEDGDRGFPPIFYAVERADGDQTMLRFLLERRADSSIRMTNDWTPLHMAAIGNKLEAARILIDAGAKIDLETRIDDYRTPAMEASARGHVRMVRLLLEAGADPRRKSYCGETIAGVAAKRSRRRIAELVASRKHA